MNKIKLAFLVALITSVFSVAEMSNIPPIVNTPTVNINNNVKSIKVYIRLIGDKQL